MFTPLLLTIHSSLILKTRRVPIPKLVPPPRKWHSNSHSSHNFIDQKLTTIVLPLCWAKQYSLPKLHSPMSLLPTTIQHCSQPLPCHHTNRTHFPFQKWSSVSRTFFFSSDRLLAPNCWSLSICLWLPITFSPLLSQLKLFEPWLICFQIFFGQLASINYENSKLRRTG